MSDVWNPRFDAGRPVFAPLVAAMEPFRRFAVFPPLEAWNEGLPAGLASAAGAPIRFVDQPPRRRRGQPVDVSAIYDERIYAKGEVPSRSRTWHDFFNMLVWRSFPALKRAINHRQRVALQAHVEPGVPKLPSARTREMDSLAMLDEGGLLLVTRAGAPDLDAAIDEGDAATVGEAVRRGDARALLIGHAIHEHLVLRTDLVRTLVFRLEVPDCAVSQQEIDAKIGALLDGGASVRQRPDAKGMPIEDALFLQSLVASGVPVSGGSP
ncbi:MAG: DUF3025 domain-containing protein [Myxococcales bacterium]|nr:DUF3025 domain-containing protein [Myxococcales bacterium]